MSLSLKKIKSVITFISVGSETQNEWFGRASIPLAFLTNLKNKNPPEKYTAPNPKNL